ncbi:uncharacterized protein LOC111077230 isoform X2 [Drosophila obscura]|uniref:uncharacterized protein LOC111077230 isoform X2 n=1 Tax=Drosophila obscura TaxID=7282 RepID=UPI001BB2163D|nr:uncharacterized protein LOC111077230 isoform X2 [Drosophila obscura]
MFRRINSMWMVTRSLTRGAQRHLSVGTLRRSKPSAQKDLQPSAVLQQKEKEKQTVTAKEGSAIVVALKSENGCASDSQPQQLENVYKLNRRDALKRMLKEKSNKEGNEQKPGEQKTSSDHGQSPLGRQPMPWVPQPSYRGPEVKKKATAADEAPKDEQKKSKLNRRDYLRQMCKQSLLNPQEKKPGDDLQMESVKLKKESLDPARVENLNLKWKQHQQEIAKRMQNADKKKFVSRFEMNAGRKEKIK